MTLFCSAPGEEDVKSFLAPLKEEVLRMHGDNPIKTRDDRITSFICESYCQLCDNNKCNAGKIMEKYESNGLAATQMKEVSEFQLDGIACKNHVPNEGFLMFGHIIEIHYVDGRVEKKRSFYSANKISELWDNDVEYIEVLFTDV